MRLPAARPFCLTIMAVCASACRPSDFERRATPSSDAASVSAPASGESLVADAAVRGVDAAAQPNPRPRPSEPDLRSPDASGATGDARSGQLALDAGTPEAARPEL